MTKSTSTTCPYCGVGCGIIAKKEKGKLTLKGDISHPSNFGRLCSKGSNLVETLDFNGRLLAPQIDGVDVSWDKAFRHVADKFNEIIKKYGASSIAFYLSGQMLSEDYYVANKLAKGFIGTPNLDTNSRLCMASSVAGHKRAFGYDSVPACYEDLDLADLIIMVGSNAAWCHPVLFQRMKKNQNEKGAKLVAIDVRQTATTKEADLALIIKPGTDAFLFNGLLSHLAKSYNLDENYLKTHCENYDEAIKEAIKTCGDINEVAKICGLKINEIERFYNLFCSIKKTTTCYSLGIHMSSSGTDKVNAIINCHLATGRIGKVGANAFSLTGQPNAMGGREVGGLANQLAAHMDYDKKNIDIVKRFWNAPNIATKQGLKAVDLFEAVERGEIKAIWIISTNPAVSMSNAKQVQRALKKCEFVVVSDCMENNDTLEFANVKLAASSWGEKSGTVTNSERRISRQRAFLKKPKYTRPDWEIICEIAKYMGFKKEFDYKNELEIFKEHASLSGFENNGSRDFDISPLSDLSKAEYDELKPIQWPIKIENYKLKGQKRMFGDGKFFHQNKKAKLIAIKPKLPIEKTNLDFPLIAITGRIRDQWHTMSRTAKSASLSQHRPEPFVEMNEKDAKKYDIKNNNLAKISSQLGSNIFRVHITKDQKEGTIFLPIHWNKSNSYGAVVGELFASNVDEFSGQPEAKYMPVKIEPIKINYSGLIISRNPVNPKLPIFWSVSKGENCYLHSLALQQIPKEGWAARVAKFLDVKIDDLITYEDKAKEIFRAAIFEEGIIKTAVFISKGYQPLEEIEAKRWFNSKEASNNNRWLALSPKPMDGFKDCGKTICACFSIGEKTIKEAIISKKASSVEEIGKLLKAGTNCGSCLPEIKQIIKDLT